MDCAGKVLRDGAFEPPTTSNHSTLPEIPRRLSLPTVIQNHAMVANHHDRKADKPNSSA